MATLDTTSRFTTAPTRPLLSQTAPECIPLTKKGSLDSCGKCSAFGDEKIGYGYGVRTDTNNSVKIIGHGGRGLGFTSIKFYIPKTDVGVIVLENVCNEDENIIYHFENEVRKIVMNSSLSE